jgi:hypothetical protein
MKVTIIGDANMGRGIGTRLVAGGNEVDVGAGEPKDALAAAVLGDDEAGVAEGAQVRASAVTVQPRPRGRRKRRRRPRAAPTGPISSPGTWG